MDNEIKEILNYYRKIVNDKKETYTVVGKDTIFLEQLLDYITNLQEENERLRSKIWQIKDLKETWQDVKENDILVFDNNNLINFMNRLQNILQGESND